MKPNDHCSQVYNSQSLPGRVSDAGPDNPLSPDSELRSIIADAAFALQQAEDALDPFPAVLEVYGTLGALVDPLNQQTGHQATIADVATAEAR